MSDKNLVILGLDALSRELLEHWNLEALMQKISGVLRVPISDKTGKPNSAQVWSSFLTGEVTALDTFDTNHKNYRLFQILKTLRKIFPFELGLSEKLCGPETPNRFPSLNQETFLDLQNVKYYNAPFYDFDHISFDILHEAFHGESNLQTARKKLEDLLDYRIKKISEILRKNNVCVLFIYVHVLDALEHISIKPTTVLPYYKKLNTLVKEINQKYDYQILVVSDHGFDFKKGDHSKKGFFSSNYDVYPKPKKITDFYEIVIKKERIR